MRFSIVLPDEAGPAVRDRAAEAGISQSEFTRRAVLAACTPDAHQHTSPAPLEDEERTRLEEAIRAAEVSADQARGPLARLEAELQTATADRDRLTVRIGEIEDEARAERHALEVKAARLEVLAERSERERDQALAAAEKAEALAAKVSAQMEARIEELKRDKTYAEGLFADERRRSEALLPEKAGPSAGTVEAAAPVKRSIWDRILGRGTA